MRTAVVAGNLKPASRTLAAAELLAERLTGTPAEVVVDVVTLGPGLLAWGDPGVSAAIEAVRAADVLIVASPTYKATYTGVLKLFLDLFPTGGLDGVTAFPLMLGAGPGHALAPELSLRPVLVELGAVCPSPGLYLLDSAWAEPDAGAAWLEVARRRLPTGDPG
ncbi:NADPH-dependent FMN reductase [Nakamurella deserti]|uniref:NADPH-dependent FMN reductase n=1 Tax=Nakamurella deserti TaxID=2164074 RepID=UPI000DBE3ECB|nr:NAD(P)H-dependent oxidoreductase [Nakamurella deserti]